MDTTKALPGIDNALVLHLQVGKVQYRFIAHDEVAEQLERQLFQFRSWLQVVSLTVQYDPADGETITDFSMITM